MSVVNGFYVYVYLLYSSKALSSYRQIRRKYREQVWRLEQKVVAMTESQLQNGTPKSTGEALEWRKEETVLWFSTQRVKIVKYFHISYVEDDSIEAGRQMSSVALDDSKSITNIRGPQRIHLNYFRDPLDFYITNR